MQHNIIPEDIAKRLFKESNLPSIGKAGIREINKLARDIEAESGVKFIHMEIGNPGLPAALAPARADHQATEIVHEGREKHQKHVDGLAPGVENDAHDDQYIIFRVDRGAAEVQHHGQR